MRCRFAVLLLIGFVSQASAGDFDIPVLRGSAPFIPERPSYTRWSGFYVGGQVGFGGTNMNFEGATQPLIAYVLRTTALESQQTPSQWGVLGRSNPTAMSYGLFGGYNSQWDDVIVGVDVHYNRTNFFANAPVSPINRVVSAGGITYNVTVSGDASMHITDFGSARLRAGWILDNFLPYATAGFALGRADVSTNARVFGAQNPPTGYPTVPCDPLAGCVAFDFSASDATRSAFLYGWSAGGGLDVMVTPRFFLRAEYEYISFFKLMNIQAHMNTARVGAGFRF